MSAVSQRGITPTICSLFINFSFLTTATAARNSHIVPSPTPQRSCPGALQPTRSSPLVNDNGLKRSSYAGSRCCMFRETANFSRAKPTLHFLIRSQTTAISSPLYNNVFSRRTSSTILFSHRVLHFSFITTIINRFRRRRQVRFLISPVAPVTLDFREGEPSRDFILSL